MKSIVHAVGNDSITESLSVWKVGDFRSILKVGDIQLLREGKSTGFDLNVEAYGHV
jgi:hypothetical protein